MKYVVHCKKEKYDVYIGRPSKWGNPFSHKDGTTAKFKCATREEAIQKYAEWLFTQDNLLSELKTELKGKVLGCWCATQPLDLGEPYICHGQILAKLANE